MQKTVKFSAIIFVILFAFSFFACQHAPTEEVVVNKAEGNIEKSIRSEEDGFVYQAPEKWETSFESETGAISVEVNAPVTLPKVKRFPVVRGTSGDLSEEQVKTMAKALFGNVPLYNQRPIGLKTRPEIEKEIIDIKTGVIGNVAKDDPAFPEYIKPLVEELEALYKTAPETYKPEPAEYIFKDREPVGQEIRIESGAEKEVPTRLEVYKGAGSGTMMLYKTCEEEATPGGAVRVPKDGTTGINISIDQAKEIAQNTLDKLEVFSDFRFAGAGTVPYGEYKPEYTSYEQGPKCYVLYYTRSINDVAYTYASIVALSEFAPANPEEVIEVYVDHSDVIQILYRSPGKVLDTINENVKLLPFEKIQDKFTQQMKIRGAWNEDTDIIGRRIKIDRIALGMMRVNKNVNEYLYVPVWDFFGTSYDRYKESVRDPANFNEENEDFNEEFATSYLTINAIDGSVISREEGY